MLGHLSRWTFEPLELLDEGARLGPTFALRLWRPLVLGYTPEWNRFVLGDLDTFRSRKSLSQLSPYLHGGVVALDVPGHRARRAELNPAFHRKAVARFGERFDEIVRSELPTGPFDAVAWSSHLIRRFLLDAFVGPAFPRAVFDDFLAPLDAKLPGPLLPRPLLFRRMNAALRRTLADPPEGTLAEHFAAWDNGLEEARVSLAAAYDTTAHALAFGLWELAARPDLEPAADAERIVSEVLRMYPSGWIGSRVAARETEFAGERIPQGRMVLYSPYLTHRDPERWPEPTAFRPERFTGPLPAWGYVPFAAGERTCLGASLATLMLRNTVRAFADATLRQVSGDPRPRGAITLTPRGPLVLERTLSNVARTSNAAAPAPAGVPS